MEKFSVVVYDLMHITLCALIHTAIGTAVLFAVLSLVH